MNGYTFDCIIPARCPRATLSGRDRKEHPLLRVDGGSVPHDLRDRDGKVHGLASEGTRSISLASRDDKREWLPGNPARELLLERREQIVPTDRFPSQLHVLVVWEGRPVGVVKAIGEIDDISILRYDGMREIEGNWRGGRVEDDARGKDPAKEQNGDDRKDHAHLSRPILSPDQTSSNRHQACNQANHASDQDGDCGTVQRIPKAPWLPRLQAVRYISENASS